MTPLTLHLQYFGPYRETTIDFTKFTSTPLFLISGKTGSGKTTIFDGMCYALFDQTSGADRKPQAMRSDFATLDDQTQVTFTFSHRNKHYEIVRAPGQTLRKKRGDGVTDVAAKVTLTVWDGETEEKQLTKTNQVRDYLQDLLQMDGKQFAQIVLLPQGQFRRFLVAPSDEKATVLEQLFNTEIFARWSDQLVQKLRANLQQNKTALATLDRLQAELTWDPANQQSASDLLTAKKTEALLALMAQQQTDTQAAKQRADTAYQAAQQAEQTLTRRDTQEDQLVKDHQQLVTVQEQQRDLTTQQAAMTELQMEIAELDWTQAFQPHWTAWQQAQTTLAKRQAAVQTTAAHLIAAKQTVQAAVTERQAHADLPDQIAGWQKQQAQNDQIRPVYQQVAATQRQLATAQQQVTTTAATVTTAEQALQANQQQQQDQQRVIAQQDQLYTTNQTLQATASQLQDWSKQGATLRQQATVNADREQQLTQLTPQVEKAQATAAAAQQAADERYQQRLRHQIAELSAQLMPGSPCPVCGSTTHPAPAPSTVAGETVSAAAVRTAQTHATEQQQVATHLAAQLAQLTATQTTQKTAYQQAFTAFKTTVTADLDVTGGADLAVILAALATATTENQRASAENKTQLAAVKTAQVTLKQLLEQATQRQAAVETAQQASQVAQTQVERLATQLATQQRQLPAEAGTLAAFTEQGTVLQQQVTQAQTQWQALEQRVTQAQQAETVATTEAQSAQSEREQSQERVVTTEATVDEALAAHHLSRQTDQSQLETQLAAVGTLATKRRTLQEFRTQQERLSTTITELTKRIGDRPTPDRIQTQQALHDAHAQVAATQDQRYAYQEQWQHNDQLVNQLTTKLATQKTALQRTQELAELAGVLNGDGPNSRIGLERYVLQTYLRQILQVGNHRLQQLTNGRYQFVIDDSPAASKKRSGLEIDVYDDHVGEQRSVHTLSGGESFIAALALALALGEVIQRTTGSVEIDALFIDEGFGSLDEDALMTALESLESVEGKHRMIGIISHVSELRSQVPNQLQVESNGNGESRVHYQTESDL